MNSTESQEQHWEIEDYSKNPWKLTWYFCTFRPGNIADSCMWVNRSELFYGLATMTALYHLESCFLPTAHWQQNLIRTKDWSLILANLTNKLPHHLHWMENSSVTLFCDKIFFFWKQNANEIQWHLQSADIFLGLCCTKKGKGNRNILEFESSVNSEEMTALMLIPITRQFRQLLFNCITVYTQQYYEDCGCYFAAKYKYQSLSLCVMFQFSPK